MDTTRLDVLIRSLTAASSRRTVLHGLAVAIGGSAARISSVGSTRKRRNKVQLNAFGCVDVGGKCRGKDSVCCSGRCDGKKPRRDEKDTSRCVAHNAGTCQAGQRERGCGGVTTVTCTTATNANGVCNTTTGNGAYCQGEAYFYPCRKDADCRPVCGEAAACLQCMFVDGTVRTAGASPKLGTCVFALP